jgi:hypothetical protein
MAIARDSKGRVVKGTSALNPTGRPKDYDWMTGLAKVHTEEALATLVQVMQTAPEPRDRCKASEVLLDRAWGKAPVAVMGEGGGPVKVEVEAEREVLRAILARVAGGPNT